MDNKSKYKCKFPVQFFSSIFKRLLYSPISYQLLKKESKELAKYDTDKKLFLSLYYFLSHYSKLSNTIVIIDNNSSKVYTEIIKIFKNIKFHLYTPSLINEYKNIPNLSHFLIDKVNTSVVLNEEQINKYKFTNVLMVCNYLGLTKEDETILNYLEHFKQYVLKIKPIKSMIKFRLPFSEEHFCENKFLVGSKCDLLYLNGQMLLPAYSQYISNETYLILDQNPSIKKYDCVEYEEKMFYHNFVVRNKRIEYRGKSYTWDQMQECAILNKI